MNRIVIVGGSGSGKSYLAREYSRISNRLVIHLDEAYWLDQHRHLDRVSFKSFHDKVIQGESWVIDGDFMPLIQERTERATLIILLDVPRWKRNARIFQRKVKYFHRSRIGMPSTAKEDINLPYLLWRLKSKDIKYQSLKNYLTTGCQKEKVKAFLSADHALKYLESIDA